MEKPSDDINSRFFWWIRKVVYFGFILISLVLGIIPISWVSLSKYLEVCEFVNKYSICRQEKNVLVLHDFSSVVGQFYLVSVSHWLCTFHRRLSCCFLLRAWIITQKHAKCFLNFFLKRSSNEFLKAYRKHWFNCITIEKKHLCREAKSLELLKWTL